MNFQSKYIIVNYLNKRNINILYTFILCKVLKYNITNVTTKIKVIVLILVFAFLCHVLKASNKYKSFIQFSK